MRNSTSHCHPAHQLATDSSCHIFFFNDPPTTEIYTLSLHDALPISNHLYNVLEKGAQSGDPLQAVRRLVPPTAAAAQLAGMIHHREELVRERTQRKNQLTAICDELFPEFTQVCKDPNAASALALRSAFPTPAALATA